MKPNPYKTSLTIVLGFLFLFLILDLKICLQIAILVAIFSLINEKINNVIVIIWNKITEILGLIMPNVLLSTVFYVFLTPIALVNRFLSRKNLLQLKNNSESTFIESNKEFSTKSLENIW